MYCGFYSLTCVHLFDISSRDREPVLDWYGVNATEFIAYLEDFHNTFQRPLWVTEWACQNFVDTKKQCSSDDIVTFLNTTQSYMDSSDFVERYAWFGAMENLQGVNQVRHCSLPGSWSFAHCGVFLDVGRRADGQERKDQRLGETVYRSTEPQNQWLWAV